MKEKIKSQQLFDALSQKYSNTAKYIVPNAFIFKGDWETDCFIQQRSSGYCYDIEIKISRNDFFADFRKCQKHSILKVGTYQNGWVSIENGDKVPRLCEHKKRPNKFFYCVPSGLIKINEVPEYAGLMYFNSHDESIEVVKEAPFIHRDQIDFEKALCEKFYFYWKRQLLESKQFKKQINRMNDEIILLKNGVNFK
jgi:hypothetical protein